MPRRRRTYNEDQCSTMTASELVADVKPTLNRFADDTSMLGFRYLHSRYKNWFRCVWALLLVFFVGLTIYQVFERIGYYFIRNPLVTVRTYDSPTSIEFPNVVLCPKMQLKASKVAEINPDLLRVMSQIYNDDQTLNLNSSTAQSVRDFDKLNLMEIFKNAGQSIEDLFLSCQFGKHRQCIDSIKPIVTPNGLCFTVSLNSSVQRPGPESTLSMLLNLETYEAIPGWISEPGVILSMFDSTVPATAHFTEGMHLESGKVVTIPINDIRRLRRHSSGCGTSNCGGVFDESEYARAACQWVVKFEDIEKKCGCRPINSPLNRDYFLNKDSEVVITTNNASEPGGNRTLRRSFKKWSLPACSLRKELECVTKWKNEALDGRALELTQACFQDCQEVTFTTIVFGNELDVNEVSRFLPGDWEEEKEKRLKHFQHAFDILPKHRIPLIQNIQRLSDEAQQFLSDAIELFEVTNIANETHVPCTMDGEQQSLVKAINRLHTEERLWKNVASFLELMFPYHLGSLFKLLRMELDADFRLQKRQIRNEKEDGSIDLTVKQIDSAIHDLQLIETSMQNSKTVFGLKFLRREERTFVAKKVIRMVKAMLDCLHEMRQKTDQYHYYRGKCFHLFETHYRILLDARTVSRLLTPHIANDYEKFTRKLGSLLQKSKFQSVPKVFEYHNYDIDLRQFENLYRDGGKDYHALHEILKFRKAIQTDIIENINELTYKLNKVLNARISFLTDIGMEATQTQAVEQIHKTLSCLNGMINPIQTLRKSALLRAEWMSRLQREVTVAQSYSPGPQYDKVNLLFLKIYFAHFKQELIVQERSYNLFLLLAEIGGTIGLYVGATLLTVAETIVFFFEKNTRQFSNMFKHPTPV
uniref:Amiloride-sensitive sodium channel n=1 Tax=Panagrellus redivivus TaxID=6233 RepID=A0A7E4VU83_PANRE